MAVEGGKDQDKHDVAGGVDRMRRRKHETWALPRWPHVDGRADGADRVWQTVMINIAK